MGHLITIFKTVKDTSAGFHIDASEAFDRIRSGKSRDKIAAIRKEKDTDKRNQLKINLPAICFSGKFNQRADSAILKHSGLVCLDFDKFPDNKKLEEYRKTLIGNQFTYALFTSPSGNGLKVVVRIPPVIENHRKHFKALDEYYNSKYFDSSCINESRVCYESYDPDIYVNENAEVFDKKVEDEQFTIGVDTPIIPVNSENEIIQKLQKWFDNNYTMIEGQRNDNLFKLARSLNSFGVSKIEAERHLMNYQSSTFGQREIENLINSAYSYTAEHGTKFFEDNYTREKIERSIRNGSDLKTLKSEFKNIKDLDAVVHKIKQSASLEEFWEYSKQNKIVISHIKFKKFLEQNGFCKIYPAGGDMFIFVKVENNIVSNTSVAHVKDYVLNYLLEYKNGMLAYDYMAGATKYFKEDYLSLIRTSDIDMMLDTKEECYIYYKNCTVRVTKDTVSRIDYIDVNGYIWEKHIINRDYKEVDPSGCVFEKFINLVAGNDEKRVKSLYSVIGYMLHSFKNSYDNKAIIFNDEVISENPNGGSGKGIICNAIGHIKRVATLDGKQFDFDKSFPYQTVSPDTQVLIFDDVKRNFAFENLFSLVTEGITLEKKNKDAVKLPVDKSPKILITTNYTIRGEGGSFERRKIELELSSYFNEKYTPYDEFKHMLFDDWDAEEWARFDNFMILCIQFYLKNGLLAYEHHNLEVRKFINNTCHEFYEWSQENITLNEAVTKDLYFENFTQEYPDFQKKLTHRRFWQWMDQYAKYNRYNLIKFVTNGQRMVKVEGLSKGNIEKG